MHAPPTGWCRKTATGPVRISVIDQALQAERGDDEYKQFKAFRAARVAADPRPAAHGAAAMALMACT